MTDCQHIQSHPPPQGFALSLCQVTRSDFLLICLPNTTLHPQIQFIHCQIHFLIFSQVQSAQQKAGDLEPNKGEAPWLPQTGGSKLHLLDWTSLFLGHTCTATYTWPLSSPGTKAHELLSPLFPRTKYLLSRLPSAAQAASKYHLENCQMAEATAVLGT